VLLAEPRGADGAGSTSSSGTESVTIRKGANETETYAQVRRFVIIKPMEDHCICLLVSLILDELEAQFTQYITGLS
jgi:hypothetical protein